MNQIHCFQTVQTLSQRHRFSVAIVSRFCLERGKCWVFKQPKFATWHFRQSWASKQVSLPVLLRCMLHERPRDSTMLNHVWLPVLSLLMRINPIWSLHGKKKKKKKKDLILWRVEDHSCEWADLYNIGIRGWLVKNYLQISLTLFRFGSPVLKLQEHIQ